MVPIGATRPRGPLPRSTSRSRSPQQIHVAISAIPAFCAVPRGSGRADERRNVTGRIRTCHAPRFRRALYRAELRSRDWLAEPESNRRPPPYQRGALPSELSAARWARLDSNQQHHVCKTRALPLSYSPLMLQIRDKGSNLDLHVQSVASCRLDDPGVMCLRMSRSAGLAQPCRTMFSMPLAYPSTLDRLPAKAQGRAAVVLRGGALEPDALHVSGNPQAKAHANAERGFQADAQRVFLSQAGPRFSPGSSSSWASPFLVRVTRLRNDEGDPSGSPS